MKGRKTAACRKKCDPHLKMQGHISNINILGNGFYPTQDTAASTLTNTTETAARIPIKGTA